MAPANVAGHRYCGCLFTCRLMTCYNRLLTHGHRHRLYTHGHFTEYLRLLTALSSIFYPVWSRLVEIDTLRAALRSWLSLE